MKCDFCKKEGEVKTKSLLSDASVGNYISNSLCETCYAKQEKELQKINKTAVIILFSLILLVILGIGVDKYL